MAVMSRHSVAPPGAAQIGLHYVHGALVVEVAELADAEVVLADVMRMSSAWASFGQPGVVVGPQRLEPEQPSSW